ncbi:MAG: hypothetical protein LQ343_005741 [Gyalolechia ehrenbergii]|nr:MAG: hypothetical protein LQ343_005741 [Gyalolechia ehrenbergii]
MLRSGPATSLARSAYRLTTSRGSRDASNLAFRTSKHLIARVEGLKRSRSLALTAYRPLSTSLQRYATTTSEAPYDHIDKKHEKEVANEELEHHPEEVSTTSSVHQVFHEKGVPDEEKDVDMLAGIYGDLVGAPPLKHRLSRWLTVVAQRVIKETFALNEVPREALYIGMAGLLPYAATSLSTVYLAWDINHASLDGQGFLISGETAEFLLHIIQPLQMGYGAVIISFLGAIHWGLEWAKFGGTQGYRRYAYGVVAPAVAWPTLLLPVEYALIAQFTAFCFLYFADAKAVVRGWAPAWYSTYRFVLTFVVGASIVLSLIGRGQIVDKLSRLPSPADRLRELRESQVAALEQEERERRMRVAAEDEEEEEEDGDEDEEE